MMTFGIAHSGWPENGRKVTVLAAKAVEETQGKGSVLAAKAVETQGEASVLAAKSSGKARQRRCLSREHQWQGKGEGVVSDQPAAAPGRSRPALLRRSARPPERRPAQACRCSLV